MNTIIVCDIGGTNSRFAIFSSSRNNELKMESELWEKTDAVDSFEQLLESLKEKNAEYAIANYRNFIVAIPGPVTTDDLIVLPNVKWKICKSRIEKIYPGTTVSFINDFVAQAFGCLTEAAGNVLPIISVKDSASGRRGDLAVVGAGTGTGHGALKKIQDSSHYVPIPSEAGHTPFPFLTKREGDFQDFLIKKIKTTYPVCNNVLSGQGLSLLHEFLTGKGLSPGEVITEITPDSETTAWFSRFYGRGCKNYALTVLASGGELFVSGGVAIKNPFLVDNDIFRNEFVNCPSKLDLLKSIPVSLITDEKIGLYGAAYCAIAQRGL